MAIILDIGATDEAWALYEQFPILPRPKLVKLKYNRICLGCDKRWVFGIPDGVNIGLGLCDDCR